MNQGPDTSIAWVRDVFGCDAAGLYYAADPSRRPGGAPDSHGYLRVQYRGKTYKLHRIMWAWHHGEWPAAWVTHIDGDRTNNCIENLGTTKPGQYERNAQSTEMRQAKSRAAYRTRAASAPEVTQALLHELFKYDTINGGLYWRGWAGRWESVRGARQRFGSVGIRGYRAGSIRGHGYKEHRLVWLYVYGAWPADVIDHINGDKTDNRIANLRDVPQVVNTQNRKGAGVRSKTGVLGVTQYKPGRYGAYASLGAGLIWLGGGHETAGEAEAVRLSFVREHYEGNTL